MISPFPCLHFLTKNKIHSYIRIYLIFVIIFLICIHLNGKSTIAADNNPDKKRKKADKKTISESSTESSDTSPKAKSQRLETEATLTKRKKYKHKKTEAAASFKVSTESSDSSPKTKRQRFEGNINPLAEPESTVSTGQPRKHKRKTNRQKRWRKAVRERAEQRRLKQQKEQENTSQDVRQRVQRRYRQEEDTRTSQTPQSSKEASSEEQNVSSSISSKEKGLKIESKRFGDRKVIHQHRMRMAEERIIKEHEEREKRRREDQKERCRIKLKGYWLNYIEQKGGIIGLNSQIIQARDAIDRSADTRTQRLYERDLDRNTSYFLGRFVTQRARGQRFRRQNDNDPGPSGVQQNDNDPGTSGVQQNDNEAGPSGIQQNQGGASSFVSLFQSMVFAHRRIQWSGRLEPTTPQQQQEERLRQEARQRRLERIRREEERRERERQEDEEEAAIAAVEIAEEDRLARQATLLQREVVLAKELYRGVRRQALVQQHTLEAIGYNFFASRSASESSSEKKSSTEDKESSSESFVSINFEPYTDSNEEDTTKSDSEKSSQHTSTSSNESSDPGDTGLGRTRYLFFSYRGDPEPPRNNAPPPLHPDSDDSDEEPQAKRQRIEEVSEDSSSSFTSGSDSSSDEKKLLSRISAIRTQAINTGDEGPSNLIEQRAINPNIDEEIQRKKEEERLRMERRQEESRREAELEAAYEESLQQRIDDLIVAEENMPFPYPVREQRGKILCSELSNSLSMFFILYKIYREKEKALKELEYKIRVRQFVEEERHIPPLLRRIQEVVSSIRERISANQEAQQSSQQSPQMPVNFLTRLIGETEGQISTAEETSRESLESINLQLREYIQHRFNRRVEVLTPLNDSIQRQEEENDKKKEEEKKRKIPRLNTIHRWFSERKMRAREDIVAVEQQPLSERERAERLQGLRRTAVDALLREHATEIIRTLVEIDILNVQKKIIFRHLEQERAFLLAISEYLEYRPRDEPIGESSESSESGTELDNEPEPIDQPNRATSDDEANSESSSSIDQSIESIEEEEDDDDFVYDIHRALNLGIRDYYQNHSGRIRSKTLKLICSFNNKLYNREGSLIKNDEDSDNESSDEPVTRPIRSIPISLEELISRIMDEDITSSDEPIDQPDETTTEERAEATSATPGPSTEATPECVQQKSIFSGELLKYTRQTKKTKRRKSRIKRLLKNRVEQEATTSADAETTAKQEASTSSSLTIRQASPSEGQAEHEALFEEPGEEEPSDAEQEPPFEEPGEEEPSDAEQEPPFEEPGEEEPSDEDSETGSVRSFTIHHEEGPPPPDNTSPPPPLPNKSDSSDSEEEQPKKRVQKTKKPSSDTDDEGASPHKKQKIEQKKETQPIQTTEGLLTSLDLPCEEGDEGPSKKQDWLREQQEEQRRREAVLAERFREEQRKRQKEEEEEQKIKRLAEAKREEELEQQEREVLRQREVERREAERLIPFSPKIRDIRTRYIRQTLYNFFQEDMRFKSELSELDQRIEDLESQIDKSIPINEVIQNMYPKFLEFGERAERQAQRSGVQHSVNQDERIQLIDLISLEPTEVTTSRINMLRGGEALLEDIQRRLSVLQQERVELAQSIILPPEEQMLRMRNILAIIMDLQQQQRNTQTAVTSIQINILMLKRIAITNKMFAKQRKFEPFMSHINDPNNMFTPLRMEPDNLELSESPEDSDEENPPAMPSESPTGITGERFIPLTTLLNIQAEQQAFFEEAGEAESAEAAEDSETGSVCSFTIHHEEGPPPPDNEAVPPLEYRYPSPNNQGISNGDLLDGPDDTDLGLVALFNEDSSFDDDEEEALGLAALFNEKTQYENQNTEYFTENNQNTRALWRNRRIHQKSSELPDFLLGYNKAAQDASLKALHFGTSVQISQINTSMTCLVNQVKVSLPQQNNEDIIEKQINYKYIADKLKNKGTIFSLPKGFLQQAIKFSAPNKRPCRMFASMSGSKSSIGFRASSAQFGIIINPVSKIRFGVAYSYEKDALKKQTGISLNDTIGYAKIGSANKVISGVFSWNSNSPGINGIFIASKGWGKAKHQRYFSQNKDVIKAKGTPEVQNSGLLVQLGYTAPLTSLLFTPNTTIQSALITPYIKISFINSMIKQYTEKNMLFSSIVGQTHGRTIEKTIGIHSQFTLYDRYDLQLWTAFVHGQTNNTSLRTHVMGYNKPEFTVFIPQKTERYIQGEFGVSLNMYITKALGFGITGNIHTKAVKALDKKNIHVRLWYDF